MRGRSTVATFGRIGALAAAAAVLAFAAPATAPADGPPSAEFPVRLTWSGPPSAHPGTAFTYTATVINTGAVARTVFLRESAVAGGLSSLSAIPGQGSCAPEGPDGRKCTLGSVAPGASATVMFTSKASFAGELRISLSADDGAVATFETYQVNVIPVGAPLETDVRLSITGPDTIHQSELGVYTITAHNADSVMAHGVVLRGYVTPDDRLVRAGSGGVTCPIVPTLTPAADCEIGDLAPGASVEMRIEAVASSIYPEVRASLNQSWNGTTTTHSYERRWTLPMLPRVEPASTQPGGPGGDLELRVGHPDTGPVGAHLVFTETITNVGSSPSGPLMLTLISSFADIIEHDHAECTPGVQFTVCTLPGLAAGASRTMTFRAYPFHLSGGPMVHTDHVASNGSQASASWVYGAVNPALPAADLSVTPLGGYIATPICGTATSASVWKVTNNGPSRAFGVLFLDTVTPATTHFVSGSDAGQLDWLEPGASTTITLFTSGQDVVVHHSLRVYHGGPDPLLGNNAASMDAPAAPGGGGGCGGGGSGGVGGGTSVPDLSVKMTSNGSSFAAGAEVDVVVTVANTGGAGSLQTHLVIELPATMTLLGPPAFDRGSGCTGSQRIDCFLDYIPNGASSKVVLAARVSGSGSQAIVATASADRDNNPADNQATLTVQVGSPTPAPPPVRTPTVQQGITKTGTAKANTLLGTSFADLLRGLGGNDTLNGKAGADKLYGGAGNDTITGGPGRDLLDGGPGADRINARDGQKDTVRCGTGRDTVGADRLDAIAPDCEIVKRL